MSALVSLIIKRYPDMFYRARHGALDDLFKFAFSIRLRDSESRYSFKNRKLFKSL
jgi:hypothetical protein